MDETRTSVTQNTGTLSQGGASDGDLQVVNGETLPPGSTGRT